MSAHPHRSAMINERVGHRLIVLDFTKNKTLIRTCKHTRNTAFANGKQPGEVAVWSKPSRLPYIYIVKTA